MLTSFIHLVNSSLQKTPSKTSSRTAMTDANGGGGGIDVVDVEAGEAQAESDEEGEREEEENEVPICTLVCLYLWATIICDRMT